MTEKFQYRYPANLATYVESWIFVGLKCPFLNGWYAETWYDILCPSLFLVYCTSFMLRSLLLGGVGLHIHSWESTYGFMKKWKQNFFVLQNEKLLFHQATRKCMELQIIFVEWWHFFIKQQKIFVEWQIYFVGREIIFVDWQNRAL